MVELSVGDELPSLAVTTPLGFIVDVVLPEAVALMEPSLEEAEEKASLFPILTASKEDPVAEVSMLVIEEASLLLVVEVSFFIAIVYVISPLSNVSKESLSLMVEASLILIVAVSAFSLVAVSPSLLTLTAEVSLVVLDGLHVDASNLSPAIESTSYFRWMIFSRAAPTQSTHKVSKSPVSGFA